MNSRTVLNSKTVMNSKTAVNSETAVSSKSVGSSKSAMVSGKATRFVLSKGLGTTRHSGDGFTLVELLLVLSILSILLGLSLPNFQAMYAQRQADVVIRKVSKAIQLARMSAIRTGKLVTLCRSDSGVECGGEWRDGIIVFSDRNGDRKINQDDVLQQFITFPGINGSLKWRAFQNRQYLQITNQGFTRYQNGNFTYCPNNGDASLARQLIINRTARIRFAIDSDGDGIREDSRGRPISCN